VKRARVQPSGLRCSFVSSVRKSRCVCLAARLYTGCNIPLFCSPRDGALARFEEWCLESYGVITGLSLSTRPAARVELSLYDLYPVESKCSSLGRPRHMRIRASFSYYNSKVHTVSNKLSCSFPLKGCERSRNRHCTGLRSARLLTGLGRVHVSSRHCPPFP
jgi:hypothetical protein